MITNNKLTVKSVVIYFLSALLGCLLLSVTIMQYDKSSYRKQIRAQLKHLAQHQQLLLQPLSKNLLDAIRKHDFNSVATNLRAYEELLFGLSKQGLSLPLSLHYVSLTVPQQIIGSSGKVSNHFLSPDEAYYLQVAEHPNILSFSKSYVTLAMPDYLLCNWGVGIIDHNNVYYGQLDAKASVDAVYNYIRRNLPLSSKVFSFNLLGDSVLQPKIMVNSINYYMDTLRYTIIFMIVITLFAISTFYMRMAYRIYATRERAFKATTEQLKQLALQYEAMKLFMAVQHKYGILAASEGKTFYNGIAISQLLADIHDVNALLAMERKVKVIFPNEYNNMLQFNGNALRLMQILSGILYETILQLAANATVILQLIVSDMQQEIQQLQFKFIDDGFYHKLEDRNVSISNSDVRVQGWGNIHRLIELENGILQHDHTAYSGNVIIFTILRKIDKKVVNIENYY